MKIILLIFLFRAICAICSKRAQERCSPVSRVFQKIKKKNWLCNKEMLSVLGIKERFWAQRTMQKTLEFTKLLLYKLGRQVELCKTQIDKHILQMAALEWNPI